MTTELSEKITKLSTLLAQVPKGTPTYTTIEKQLSDLISERDQASASKATPDPSEQTSQSEAQSDPDDSKQRPVNESIFQAVGVIQGQIATETVLNDDGEERLLYSVVVQGKKYRLKILGYKFKHFIRQVKNSPEQQLYLMVYPYLQFIPKKTPELRFQVVSWQDTPYKHFSLNEFNLRGIWQFIPQHRRPLMTIMRNWMDKKDRNKLLEKGQDFKSVHVPIFWKDAQLPPFRFNPRAEKQGERFFVEMKAKFIPKLDTFGFTELLAEPTTTFPRYLLPKAKMEKLAEKRQAKKEKQKQETQEQNQETQDPGDE